jgi:hypothetical protein
VEYHKQQGELHYHDNSLEEADTPASVEVANVMHMTSMFLHLSCHHFNIALNVYIYIYIYKSSTEIFNKR